MEPIPNPQNDEQEIITIFDPFDEPFGPLSLNAQIGVIIDGEVYKSVAHYMFSRPLKTPSYRSLVVSQSSTRTLKDMMLELYRKNLSILENAALDRALIAKFNIPEMRDGLIATGDAILIYRNETDTNLGVNSQGYGENKLGKKLMELRDRLAIDLMKFQHAEGNKRYYNAVYVAYLADKILESLVKSGTSSLTDYMAAKATADQIVDFYGRERIVKESPTYFAVMEMFKKNLIPKRILVEAVFPGTIAQTVLADNIEDFRANYDNRKKRAIFDMYFTRVLQRNFPDLSPAAIQRVKDREIGKLEIEDYGKFVDRVYSLYKAGRVDPMIVTEIDHIYFAPPTQQDIDTLKESVASIYRDYEQYMHPHGMYGVERPVEEIVIVEKQAPKKSSKDLLSYIKSKMAKYQDVEPEKLLGKTEKDFPTKDDFMRAYQKKLEEIKNQIKIQYQTAEAVDELLGGAPTDIDVYMEKFLKMNPEEIVGVPMSSFKTKGGFRRAYQKKLAQIRLEGMRLIKEEKEMMKREEPVPYIDEGKTSINFGDPANAYYGFLSNEFSYKFLVIDSLPYPTVSHYITAVKLTALTYIKNTVVSHPYIKIDPVGNSYSFDNYKPFDEMERMFDELSTKDIINTIVDNMIKANRAKFKNPKLASLLLATGSSPIAYGDYRDDLLGVGENDRGENIAGKDLMENRRRILENNAMIKERMEKGLPIEPDSIIIEPAKVKILPLKSVQELTLNNEKFKDWFNMRINDAVSSITKFAQYLVKKGMMDIRITAAIAEFVLFQLYGNCMSIAEKSHEIYKIPKDFSSTIRRAFSGFDVDRSAIEVIWRYGTFLSLTMLDFFKGLAETSEDINNGVQEVSTALINKTDLKCPGPYKGADAPKNCVGHAFRNIFKSLQSFFRSRNFYFDVESDEMNLAMSLIAPKGDIPDLEIKAGGNPYNMIAIVGGVPVDSLVSKSGRAPQPDVIITRNQAETIEAFGQAMFALTGDDANIAVSRLVFFATSLTTVTEVKKVDIIIAQEEAPPLDKEVEDKDDEEEGVEDYGDDVEILAEEDD